MKRFTLCICLIILLLLLPSGVSASSYLFVYSTPPGAAIYLNGTYLGGDTPRQQNALPGVYNLLLTKSGYPDYSSIITIAEGSTVIIDYDFTSGALNKSGNAPILTSIKPSSGAADTTATPVTITGKNFASGAYIRLTRSGYPIVGSVDSVNSAGTKITGSFDLNNQPPGDYQVCVYNTGFVYTCGLTFTVTRPGTTTAVTTTDGTGDTDASSRVSFETNPSGATIYLDNIEIGTSDFIYHDAGPGTHNVLVRKTGYNDYSGSITIPDDKRATFSADLTPLGSDTAVTSATATPPEAGTVTPVIHITTMKKSIQKVPTTLPYESPTEESPLDPAVIAGTLCLMCLLLRNP